MISNRPYLLRAFYQWIVDSNCTPILVLNADHPRCKIPKEYVDGGEIVFNISPTAVRDIKILNDTIEFKASFSGVVHIISASVYAALAVYAEENGEGIFFDAEEEDAPPGEMVQFRSIEGTGSKLIEGQQSDVNRPRPVLRLVE
jgi:stringent starvation protein B